MSVEECEGGELEYEGGTEVEYDWWSLNDWGQPGILVPAGRYNRGLNGKVPFTMTRESLNYTTTEEAITLVCLALANWDLNTRDKYHRRLRSVRSQISRRRKNYLTRQEENKMNRVNRAYRIKFVIRTLARIPPEHRREAVKSFAFAYYQEDKRFDIQEFIKEVEDTAKGWSEVDQFIEEQLRPKS